MTFLLLSWPCPSARTCCSRRRTPFTLVSANARLTLRPSPDQAIKHRSAIPGGTCEFDLPDYCHWLHLPAETRRADFNAWLSVLRPLCETIGDVLWVTRENSRPRRELAAGGTFQLAFERENPIHLLRIALPGDSPLYPEISGSHHRCSIRFLEWSDVHNRPTQADGDVPFVLTCCT